MIFGGTLNRVIFFELLRVFLLSITGLTAMFLIAGIIQQATQFGLSPAQVFRIIPLLIPSSLPYTIPATTLFATCVVYGRIAQDNEAVALKAAGVDLYTILRPALMLGILTSIITASLAYQLIPYTQRQFQEEIISDPEEVLYNLLRRERVFRSGDVPWVLYVREVQDRSLIDVVAKRKSKKDGLTDEYDLVARTREAKMRIDRKKNTLTIDSDDWVFFSNTVQVDANDNRPQEIELPDSFRKDKLLANQRGRPTTLDWDELPEMSMWWQDVAQSAEVKLAELRSGQFEVPMPADEQARQDTHYQEVIKFNMRMSRTLMLEYHMRPALAFGCILFAWIGCPVGMWANRSDYLSTFVICFLPTVFAYYPLLLSGGGMARDGKIPMVIGVWAANAIAGLAAILLTWRLIRR